MKIGFQIKNLSDVDITSFKPLLEDLISYTENELKYDQPVKVILISDPENAVNVLGKTAHYQPATKTVTIYVDDRHPKDILRSVAHELVHHAQNCRGDFDSVGSMGEGYAQSDQHLRDMEREAYEKGNLCFRDWEDGLKTNKKKQTNYIIAINEGLVMNEYGDHETQASGGLVASNYSSDPSMDQVEDVALDAIARGGSLMQIATALKDEGFDAHLSSGALMIQGTSREQFFIGKASDFEIGPDEEVRQIGPYVLGYMDSSIEEGWITTPAVDYCKGNCKSEAEASKQCGAVGVSLEEEVYLTASDVPDYLTPENTPLPVQKEEEGGDYGSSYYAPYAKDMGGGGILNMLTRALRVREGKIDREQLKEIVRKALQEEVNCEFGGAKQIVPEGYKDDISKAVRSDPTEPDPNYQRICIDGGFTESKFKGNNIMKNKNKLGLTSLNENWNKFLEEGGDKRKQKWMQAFQNAAGNPQPPPQDFWDTATYLYNQGEDPVAAGEKYAANNMNEGYDAGKAVWMEKFKLHAQLPQNQEMSDDWSFYANQAQRDGKDPKQAAEELVASGLKEYGDHETQAKGGWGEFHGNAADGAPTKDAAVSALSKLDKAVAHYAERGAEGDARDLQDIRDQFAQEIESGAGPGTFSDGLKNSVSYLDTIIRDEIPADLYYSLFPSALEEGLATSGQEFQIGDMVQVVGGGVAGATGEIVEFAEGKAVVRLETDADKPVFGKADDEVIVRGEWLEPMDGMSESWGEDEDYFDALEAEFPFLAKSVKAGEVPEEVAVEIAKEYGDKEEPQGQPMAEEDSDLELGVGDESQGGSDKEEQIRKIVADKQAANVEDMTLDLYSASAIVKVLDAINDQNKEKYLAMPVDKMAQIAFKMMK